MENINQESPKSEETEGRNHPTVSQPLQNINALLEHENSDSPEEFESNNILEEHQENKSPTNSTPNISPPSLSEIDELELKILSSKQELRSKTKESRSYFRIALILGAVFIALLYWAIQTNGVVSWILTIVFAFFALLLLIASLGSRLNEEKANAEIEALEARKRILSRFDAQPSEKNGSVTSSYFDKLVRINIENLAEYYSLIKVHTNNSFRISAISGVVGFILIVFG